MSERRTTKDFFTALEQRIEALELAEIAAAKAQAVATATNGDFFRNRGSNKQLCLFEHMLCFFTIDQAEMRDSV